MKHLIFKILFKKEIEELKARKNLSKSRAKIYKDPLTERINGYVDGIDKTLKKLGVK